MVVDSERKHVYAFSERFRLRRSRGSVMFKQGIDKAHELQIQLEEVEMKQVKDGTTGDVSMFGCDIVGRVNVQKVQAV